MACWRSEARQFAPGSDGVLLAATSGALGVRLNRTASNSALVGEDTVEAPSRAEPQISHLASAVGQVWRSVVLWMLLLALVTVARWQI